MSKSAHLTHLYQLILLYVWIDLGQLKGQADGRGVEEVYLKIFCR